MWKEIKYLDTFTIKYKFVKMVNSNKATFPLGHFYFLIGDKIIGKPEELVYFKYVYDGIYNFSTKSKYNNRFVTKEFYNCDESVIFYTLYEQFFSACYDTYSLKEQDDLFYKKEINEYCTLNEYNSPNEHRTSYETIESIFHMDSIGEDTFFDHFGLTMINCENKQKLIIKDFRQNKLICQEYDIGVVDKLLNEFACIIANAQFDNNFECL